MLSNQSVRGNDFRITLKLSEIGMERCFPKAADIAESLLPGSAECRICAVSDMFPHGFVYKPFLYDAMIVDGDENYRQLKKIKAAKFISHELLQDYKDGSELFRKLNAKAAGIPFEHVYKYIVSSFDRIDETAYFNPQNRNPFESAMIRNGNYDFYLCCHGDFNRRNMRGKRIPIKGNVFTILDVVSMNTRDAATGRCILQGDLPVTLIRDVETFNNAIFRCKFDPDRKIQYIRAGSVLPAEYYSIVHLEDTTSILPYVIRI